MNYTFNLLATIPNSFAQVVRQATEEEIAQLSSNNQPFSMTLIVGLVCLAGLTFGLLLISKRRKKRRRY